MEGNIALRDKQPRRVEIEIELRELEVKQRELEHEGVAMEKKLRELGDSMFFMKIFYLILLFS